ncbi:hypothetical protein BD324DRAFT_650915 [Kockovaella imperatae]|uniref:Uncharacterized protein n=1 Tax=Kockovaella imperatae TaxID=4999 RepID=A0A1Y1UJK9_9TREE|nr:hypothetical protein BD324DRAFT_650915 [Kockovaella imperatae]ORX37315.1 hypothetical protein BD324DRAFT_650915 [Kockovaella imperatae]
MYPYTFAPPMPTDLGNLGSPAPIYVILIVGMVLFMASHTMPALLPDPAKVGQVAPMILQWGFGIILLALLTQMTGLVPGVPQLHITYVHLATAFIIFFLIWNQVIAEIPEEESDSKRSTSSSSEKKDEKPEKKESKKETAETEPSPWDDLRAHPSAFLTTRLNRYLPWPFPMGRAAALGPELWWESGQPAHVGHYNRPEPEVKESEEQRKKRKEKEVAKEREKEKEKEKAKAKAEAVKEAEKAKEQKKAEENKRKELEKAKIKAAEMARLKALDDRQKQKLWRTKFLAMIIGIGLINRTLGFLLLLAFSLQLVSQELNVKPIPEAPVPSTSSGSFTRTSSSSESRSKIPSSKSTDDLEKAKRAKLDALKRQDEAAKPSESTSSTSSRGSSRRTESEQSSRSSKSSSSPSSKSSDIVTSSAIKEAAGSKTVTGIDPDSGVGVPYNIGFGVAYIHTKGELGALDIRPTVAASPGMIHPLMSSNYKGWAN